jgi:MFS superfamily sulfate permease-like transporter
VHAESFFPRLRDFALHLGETRPVTVAVGLGTLAFLQVMRVAAPRAPAALIAVGLATLLSVALDLPRHGLRVGSPIPSSLPSFTWPHLAIDDLRALFPTAVGLTMVAYTDNVLTARSVAAKQGYRVDANRELAALGLTNLAAALVGGYPISAAASRTAVPAALGSKTQVVSLVAAAFVVAAILGLGPILSKVPEAALAGVVLSAGLGIVEIGELQRLRKVSRLEVVLALAGALAVLLVGVLDGVILAVGASGLLAFYRVARPHDAVLARAKDLDGWVDAHQYGLVPTDGLLVYRFDAPLFFANANRFRERVNELLEQSPGREEWVVLDFEGIGEIDATALDMLHELTGELVRADMTIAVARANEVVLERLGRAELIDPKGPVLVFATINAAVKSFRDRTGRRTLAPSDPASGPAESDGHHE